MATKQTTGEITEEAQPLTLQEHGEALQRWLRERGLVIVPVAQGRRTGQVTALDDFLGETHRATYILSEAQS